MNKNTLPVADNAFICLSLETWSISEQADELMASPSETKINVLPC